MGSWRVIDNRVQNENVKEVSTRVREVIEAAQDGSDFIPAEKVFPNLADPEKRPVVALRGEKTLDGSEN